MKLANAFGVIKLHHYQVVGQVQLCAFKESQLKDIELVKETRRKFFCFQVPSYAMNCALPLSLRILEDGCQTRQARFNGPHLEVIMTRPLFFLISFVITLSHSTAAVQQSTIITLLEPGKPIERELAVNDSHSYRLDLAANQYVLVQAEQRALDVALTVFDPTGKKLLETDLFRTGELESIFLVAEQPGSYRVEVRRADKNRTQGHYELKVKELRPATAQDSIAVSAETLVSDGMRVEQQQTADARRKAVEKYLQSIPLWEAAKDITWEARTLGLITSGYTNLCEKQKAFDSANQA